MIDTIRIALAVGSWAHLPDIDSGWDINDTQAGTRKFIVKERSDRYNVERKLWLTHRATGLRVWGTDLVPEWLEVSLPRVLHGRNASLIKNDFELCEAFLALQELLLQVRVPLPSESSTVLFSPFLKCTRLDLCWHFKGLIQEWIESFRLSGHPRVRRPLEIFSGTGLVWPGSGVRIRMYDKRREVYRKAGDIVRVEHQLRGMILKDLGLRLFDEAWLGGFERLWSIFKDLTLPFNPEMRHEVSTLAEILALGESLGVKFGVQSPFELWASGKHRSTVSRMKKLISESVPRRVGVDLWALCSSPVAYDLAVE